MFFIFNLIADLKAKKLINLIKVSKIVEIIVFMQANIEGAGELLSGAKPI